MHVTVGDRKVLDYQTSTQVTLLHTWAHGPGCRSCGAVLLWYINPDIHGLDFLTLGQGLLCICLMLLFKWELTEVAMVEGVLSSGWWDDGWGGQAMRARQREQRGDGCEAQMFLSTPILRSPPHYCLLIAKFPDNNYRMCIGEITQLLNVEAHIQETKLWYHFSLLYFYKHIPGS